MDAAAVFRADRRRIHLGPGSAGREVRSARPARSGRTAAGGGLPAGVRRLPSRSGTTRRPAAAREISGRPSGSGERGVRFRFVLDEGGGLTEGIIDGISRPVAFVGLAEKGYATIRITARAEGGHASMPPPHTAVGMASAVVGAARIEPVPGADRRRDGRDARLHRSRTGLAASPRSRESLADRSTGAPAVRRQAVAQRADPDHDGGHRGSWRRDRERAPESGRSPCQHPTPAGRYVDLGAATNQVRGEEPGIRRELADVRS